MYKLLFRKEILSWAQLACRACLPLLAGVLCAAPGYAQSEDEEPAANDVEITLFGGYTTGGEFEDPNDDTDRDLESDASFGAIVDFVADEPGLHYELYYSNQSTDVEGNSPLDLDVQYLHIGGIVDYIRENRRIIPFFGGGLGATLLSPDRSGFDDENDFSLSLTGGFKIPLGEHVAIRLDTRAFFTFLSSDSSVFCISTPAIGGACDIRAKGDSFVQFSAGLGITAGF